METINRPIDLSKYSAVVATQPAAGVSERYRFIPTTDALTVLSDFGWFPKTVQQSRTRKPENEGFQRHFVRLVNERYNQQMTVGSTVPEIVLNNSHSGTAAFSLMVGLFEKICSNGLVVQRANFGSVRVTHAGYSDVNMADAVRKTMEAIPETLQLTDSFKRIMLTHEEQLAFADSAIELRYDGDKYAVSPAELIRPTRHSETIPTLWNTYNVVQEKIIRGGVRQQRRDGSVIRSRQIQNVHEDMRLNKALWTLAEKMAELKA